MDHVPAERLGEAKEALAAELPAEIVLTTRVRFVVAVA
jgi:hypothetical protein